MSLQAPLIPSSSNLDSNITIDYKVTDKTIVKNLTDGVAVLENGFLKNLNEPVNNSDAATKNFVDTFSGSATAGGPLTSVQFNDGADGFTGSANLTFNKVSGLLTLNGNITNGTINLTGDVLTGIATPVADQDAANRAYVISRTSFFDDVTIDITQQIGLEINVTYNQINNTFMNLNFI